MNIDAFAWWPNRKSRIGQSVASLKPPHVNGRPWWTTPPVAAMTITQWCAALLLVASLDLPFPEYHRHFKARLDLSRCLRGLG